MLLEAMIAILIFSLGVLGIVGMQASAVAATRDAKYRTDASLLANQIIGEMWSSATRIDNAISGPDLRDDFQGDGDDTTHPAVVDGGGFIPWRGVVEATLPGAVDNPPSVAVTPGVANAVTGVIPPSVVIVTVRWRAAISDPVHNYRVVVQII